MIWGYQLYPIFPLLAISRYYRYSIAYRSYCVLIIERSLKVKLPTIWTDEKQRWEESEKRREEKRREEERESRRRKKIQVREKVGKSRNIVFLQWFVSPEGRKVGSLKWRVRSQLARWEMKNCTLQLQLPLHCTTRHYTTTTTTLLHYNTLDYTNSLHHATTATTTTLHYTTLHYNYNDNYTTLHYNTLDYTTLYHATVHNTTVH